MSEAVMGIGALSRACGIPVETLRTWERRYGFPVPIAREDSSHRRYPIAAVERLLQIKLALANGNKPSIVVGAEPDDLARLLAVSRPDESAVPAEGWFAAVERLDANELDRAFAQGWDERGAIAFLQNLAGPFLIEVGERWARGEISVAHEHFASQRLASFLTGCRERLRHSSPRQAVIVTTLPGEQHTLGAHMAAVVFAIAGLDVVFLGSETPVEDLVQASVRRAAVAVAISISVHYPASSADIHLRALSELLPPKTRLYVGGAGGAATTVSAGRCPQDFAQLLDQARQL